MKWLEVIHLCTLKHDMKKVIDEISGQLASVNADREPCSIRLYTHPRLDNELKIHIYWDEKNKKKPESLESTLGQSLTQMLKEHGMTNYSVWVEGEIIDRYAR